MRYGKFLLIFLFMILISISFCVAVSAESFETWNLPENYTLVVKMINVDGNKAWIQLLKNGSIVKETIVNSAPWSNPNDRVFLYEKT